MKDYTSTSIQFNVLFNWDNENSHQGLFKTVPLFEKFLIIAKVFTGKTKILLQIMTKMVNKGLVYL